MSLVWFVVGALSFIACRLVTPHWYGFCSLVLSLGVDLLLVLAWEGLKHVG